MISSEWKTSSYSQNGGQCVEARVGDNGATLVRDTQNREAGTLAFPAAEWAAFLADADRL
ncbi:DUF397 domain-containing protein [Streptomonospora nanhaiensis]|uniref:DUF397 domain-containing protein n=1 Tax=Streptomonospora nanhaiensis TaxID=1323731 RepID=UPI001C388423|nr:DUF397 domain-containing protein [Streptomonospora nanhaiensis]MBV2364411.1 DUF397 domain-containing protein [Streptomonospora nanhaiensis]MBX9388445.1 DUF397 domain-containing protein [Streptomonospora nanhaiensis]